MYFIIKREGDFMNDTNGILKADFKDLTLNECGREKCQPGKVITNDVKAYHLFHYILYGSGTFVFQDKVYNLKKGDLFYIPPGETAKYYPKEGNPWIYTWVGFSGERSNYFINRLGLSYANPIYKDTKSYDLNQMFNELADKYNYSKYLSIELLSVFLNILYKMIIVNHEDEIILSARQTHIRMARQFIENNFQFKIKIIDIADSLSISPNYLANIFKQELGKSPKQVLTEYRMQKACNLLTNTRLNIAETAKRVGYPNPLHFSAEFKKIKGVSPKKYKIHNGL